MAPSILAMFPGQGSQSVGMGRELLDAFPYCARTFEEAEDAAHFGVRRMCLEGPESELMLTANTQPCIVTVSVAVWRVLKQEAGIEPAFFAGHSLGEYSALVASGKLAFSRAVMLVRRRGEAMQKAVPAGIGAMAAVMDCPASDLEARCAGLSREGHVVEVVNYNSDKQIVVSGHKAAVEKLIADLEAAKVRSVLLPVSAPFHSSLMRPARDAMAPLLQETHLETNDSRVIANTSGKVEHPYTTTLLEEQIDHAVRWTQTLTTARESGVTSFMEVGPGKVLFGLARRSLPRDMKLAASDDAREAIKKLQEWAQDH